MRNETSLENLYLQNNKLYTHYEDPNFFPYVLSSLPNLKKINLSGLFLSPENEYRGRENVKILKSLLDTLKGMNFLENLSLTDNYLEDSNVPELVDFIKRKPSLRFLDLRWNHLTDRAFSYFSSDLSQEDLGTSSLVSILLEGNKGTEEAEKNVQKTIIKSILRRGYKTTSSLEDLKFHKIPEELYESLQTSFSKRGDPLKSLEIFFSDMNDFSIFSLREALEFSKIKNLKISHSDLTDSHLNLFCTLYGTDLSFEELSLSNNKLENSNPHWLSKLIKMSPRLKRLDLSWNRISNPGFKDMLNVLTERDMLYLNFSYNSLQTEELEDLRDFLQKPSFLNVVYPKENCPEKLIRDIDTLLIRNELFQKQTQEHKRIWRNANDVLGLLEHTTNSLGVISLKPRHALLQILKNASVGGVEEAFFPSNKHTFLNLCHLSQETYEKVKDLNLFVSLFLRQGDQEHYEIELEDLLKGCFESLFKKNTDFEMNLEDPLESHFRTGLWSRSFVPKKGWKLEKSHDLTDLIVPCAMCEKRIRYAHLVHHPKYQKPLWVGFLCAGYITENRDDVASPERFLRESASKRARHMDKKWFLSKKKNACLKLESEELIVILKSFDQKEYTYSFNGKYCGKYFRTQEEAQLDSLEKAFPKNYPLSD